MLQFLPIGVQESFVSNGEVVGGSAVCAGIASLSVDVEGSVRVYTVVVECVSPNQRAASEVREEAIVVKDGLVHLWVVAVAIVVTRITSSLAILSSIRI